MLTSRRVWDPVYALAIGAGAAVVRIRREEKEKGRSAQDTMDNLRRRVDIVLEKPGNDTKARGKVG